MTIAETCNKCKKHLSFCHCVKIFDFPNSNEAKEYFKSNPFEETWTKTMDLRWVRKKYLKPTMSIVGIIDVPMTSEPILQQKHISNLGNEKWVDVETVTI